MGDYKTVRHNYYQLLLELFIERWSKPWYEYTEKQNLSWTGHYWEHGWPSPHHGPDNMAMYAWHQVPGIDMLFNFWEEQANQFGSVRAVRELNSVGNQMGRKRKLSETYGASGWELSFEDMKRNGDWEYALGVNLMNQHLSYQTLMGDRKHDFPQSFSAHTPWWDEYNSLADYYARLSLALSSGEQINRVLILEPTTTAWMYYAVDEQYSDINSLDNNFIALLDKLEAEQVEYDLGSENIIRDHGAIENGKFEVGEQQYSFVVLPEYMHNINTSTADLLEEYMAKGGKVLSLGKPPVYIDGVETERCSEWPNEFQEEWLSMNGIDDPRFINYLLSDEFILVAQEGGMLFHQRRIFDDGQLLFLVNSSKQESCETRFVLQGNDIAKMNLFTGELENYPCVVTSDILSFDASIPPAGSLLLYISNDDIKAGRSSVKKWRGREKQLDLVEFEAKALSENVINLDYCYLTTKVDTTDLIYFYNAQTKIFNTHGFPKNPWVSSSQFKTSIIDRDTFGVSSGFAARFPFLIDTNAGELKMQLVVERPELYEVTVNGELVEALDGEWWLDKSFGLFDIGGIIITGENEVSVRASPMSVFCELEPVYLLGDFDVFALDKGWIIGKQGKAEIGSWKKQGYPFYSDKMEYTAQVEIDGKGMAKVVLPDWQGTLAYVEVNGKRAGQIFSSPGEVRVDNYVKRGANAISVTVIGSLKNLLGPHHNVSRRGIVTPWSFKFAPDIQPSGMDYDLLDYGLMEPFQLVVSE